MSPEDPRHGTYAGYHVHKADGEAVCEPCRDAKRLYQRRRGKQRTMGVSTRVTPHAATTHIRRLLATGMHQEDIARAAGINRMTVKRILGGELTYLHIKTAAKIVSTQPRPREHFRPSTGTVRRLQALVAIGYPQRELARLMGVEKTNFGNLIRGKRVEVLTTTHNAVAALFAELCMTPRNNPRALGVARKRGWAPPLAWDDIDDPDERPTGHLTPRSGRRAENVAARTADLEQFADADMSIDEALRQLGIDRDALWKWCDRHDRLDLYDRLARGQRRRENQHTTRRGAA